MPLVESGDANAQFVVGLMYANGQGVEQNFYEAAKMYRQAGEQGHNGAQVNLGSLFENCYGNGPCNSEAAADWYRRAADQGSAIGQYNLAVMYATGRGVAKDEWAARTLFRKAAEQGHATAQYNLAVTYERGMGGPADVVAAYAWYDLAAQKGYSDAAASRDRLGAGLTGEALEKAKAMSSRLREYYADR
jgi:TPR repeat protein